ncbi:MAG: hypothetical protein IJV80_00205, partial [Clostridia bacterium]|nr:hypothetical protein [Clostridia bacterium]
KLSSVSGLNSVKVVLGEKNGLNADSIYVNGSAELFQTMKIGGFGLDTLSRRYDVEMKTVYYVKAVQDEGETKYETVKTSIPMLFVQTKTFSDLGENVLEKNEGAFAAEPTVSSGLSVVALERFETLKALFDEIQTITYQDLVQFIGTKNPFFAA